MKKVFIIVFVLFFKIDLTLSQNRIWTESRILETPAEIPNNNFLRLGFDYQLPLKKIPIKVIGYYSSENTPYRNIFNFITFSYSPINLDTSVLNLTKFSIPNRDSILFKPMLIDQKQPDQLLNNIPNSEYNKFTQMSIKQDSLTDLMKKESQIYLEKQKFHLLSATDSLTWVKRMQELDFQVSQVEERKKNTFSDSLLQKMNQVYDLKQMEDSLMETNPQGWENYLKYKDRQKKIQEKLTKQENRVLQSLDIGGFAPIRSSLVLYGIPLLGIQSDLRFRKKIQLGISLGTSWNSRRYDEWDQSNTHVYFESGLKGEKLSIIAVIYGSLAKNNIISFDRQNKKQIFLSGAKMNWKHSFFTIENEIYRSLASDSIRINSYFENKVDTVYYVGDIRHFAGYSIKNSINLVFPKNNIILRHIYISKDYQTNGLQGLRTGFRTFDLTHDCKILKDKLNLKSMIVWEYNKSGKENLLIKPVLHYQLNANILFTSDFLYSENKWSSDLTYYQRQYTFGGMYSDTVLSILPFQFTAKALKVLNQGVTSMFTDQLGFQSMLTVEPKKAGIFIFDFYQLENKGYYPNNQQLFSATWNYDFSFQWKPSISLRYQQMKQTMFGNSKSGILSIGTKPKKWQVMLTGVWNRIYFPAPFQSKYYNEWSGLFQASYSF